MRTLSTQTQTAISKAVSTSINADKAGIAAVDLLIADGFDKPTDYISPKSAGCTITVEEFNNLNEAIVLGFAKSVQALLGKPVKSLTDAQKTTRRYWQQQKGARRNDLKRQITKRLDPVGAGSRNRSPDQRIRDNLNDVIKVCQSAEEPTFNISDMIGKVKEALAILK